jgi:large subunit ribosomal protein L13
MNAKTPFLKADQVDRTWWVVDATDLVLGRIATRIATILQGKHRPTYTPNADTGDFVIVVNAEKDRVTGNKRHDKTYDWYTYYPGGHKEMTYEELLEKHPTRPVELAVRRMLPKSRLGRQMFRKLKVYAGPEHPHHAQQPRPLELDA